MGSEASERNVPLIDVSAEDSTAAKELFEALTTVGFACLTNTGVWDMAAEYANSTRQFFEQSVEEKSKCARPISLTDNGGWVNIGREQLSGDRPGDYKECFNMVQSIRGDPERSPALLDNEKCWALWDKFDQLAHKVLYLIGLGLNLEDPHFLGKTHNFSDVYSNRSAQRIAWYPKINAADAKPGQISCGEHSDYGSITLLYSSAPGLQVVNRTTGEFVDAGYVDDGIFVNIGDLLQMWSGDVLVANKHRVLIPESKYLKDDRVSIVFFCQPDNTQVIETLDGSGKYPPVTAGGWLADKFQATYDK